jgi:hypothetical protein
MTRNLRSACVLALLVLGARNAAAQFNVARFDGAANRVYASFGSDPALVTTLGYSRVVPVMGHRFQLGGEVAVGATGFDVRDSRARLGVQTSIVSTGPLHLTGSAAFVTRTTENSVYRGLNFGADVGGTVGVYRNRWFVAGEAGFDKAIITHIRHTDWYRDNFYPGARDGWYLTGGGTARYGFAAGVAIGPVELVGRAGWLLTEKRNELLTPGYATLGVGVGF